MSVCVCVCTGTCVCASVWRSEVSCRCSAGAIPSTLFFWRRISYWSGAPREVRLAGRCTGDLHLCHHTLFSPWVLEIEFRPLPFSPPSHLPRPQGLIFWGGLLRPPAPQAMAGFIFSAAVHTDSSFSLFSRLKMCVLVLVLVLAIPEDMRWYLGVVFKAHVSD